MKITDIKKHLLSSLDSFAKTNEFKVVESKFALTQKSGDFVKQISFEYNSWEDEIHIFPYVQIKSKKIHEICRTHNFHLNFTAFINLFVLKEITKGDYSDDTRWKLQANMKDRFVICDDRSLKIATTEILKLADIGLKYLESNCNIEAIDKMYNSNPFNSTNPNCSGMDTHCIVGIIASRLSKSSKYEQIRNIYDQIILEQDFLPETKDSYTAIKVYLDTI